MQVLKPNFVKPCGGQCWLWCNSHNSLEWPPSTHGGFCLFWTVPRAPFFPPYVWKISCISSLFMTIPASDVSFLALLSIFWLRHKPKALNAPSHWRSDGTFDKRRWLTSTAWPWASLATYTLPTRNSSCPFNGHVVFHFLSQAAIEQMLFFTPCYSSPVNGTLGW